MPLAVAHAFPPVRVPRVKSAGNTCLAIATARGVDRDPGHTQKRRTPSLTSSSTTRAPQREFKFGRRQRFLTGLSGKRLRKFFSFGGGRGGKKKAVMGRKRVESWNVGAHARGGEGGAILLGLKEIT